MFTTTNADVSTGKGNARQVIEFTYEALIPTADVSAKALVEFFGEKFTYMRILKELNKRAEINAGNTARASKRIDPKEKLSTAMVYAMDEMMEDLMTVKSKGKAALENWLMQTVWPLSQERAEYRNL